MKLNKIIFSPTGGTKKVCDILSNEFHLESNEINGIWAVILFGLCAYLISVLTMKSIYLRSKK